MKDADHVILVVDDDASMRDAVENLLASLGFAVRTYASASQYMDDAQRPDIPSCLILDLELPDINGLELQRMLDPTLHPPIVFITGHGTIPSSVNAMKAGAVDFLPKPFSHEALLAAVNEALKRDRATRASLTQQQEVRRRYLSLTPREREVMSLVVSGLLNKLAAARLGISPVTLQIHRGSVMRKMDAGSLAELVRMSASLGIDGAGTGRAPSDSPIGVDHIGRGE